MTDLSISNGMLSEAIQCSAMLVTLSIAAWTPIRVDRELSGDVASARNAAERAFSVRKNRLAGGDTHFKAASKVQEEFRVYHYRCTLPFGSSAGMHDRGPRLLANANFFTYMEVLAKARANMAEHLTLAIAHYDESIALAQANLGDAFNADDYPEKETLTQRFAIDADFTPVPDGSGFKGLPDDTLTLLSEYTQKSLSQKAETAARDVIERVTTYLQRLDERLTSLDASLTYGERKATIRSSLFSEAENIADLIAAFPFIQTGALTDAMDLLRDVSRHEAGDMEDEATRTGLQARARDVFSCFE